MDRPLRTCFERSARPDASRDVLSNFAMPRALIDRMASLSGAVVPWRFVAAVALLSMLLCATTLSGTAHATLAPDGLLLAGESGEGHFGQSVALSADGNTALVGAPTGNGEAGAVWVFTRTGSTWTQQAELLPKSGEEVGNGQFGASVALSADGNTVLVGAPASAGGGAVWVFTRSGSTWAQQGEKITGAEQSAGSEFGRSVALSAEGDTAVVGAPGDGGEAGAIWVFTRSEGAEAWSQQGLKLAPEIGEEVGNGQFGASVALSAEGNTATVGAPTDNSNVGAVWAFTRTGAIWTQQRTKITGGEEVEEGRFGASVALGAEGNTALIGGPGDSKETGAAWAFTRSAEGVWAQQGAKLTAETGEESEKGAFGSSVGLSFDGDTALIGGPGDNEAIGAAWAFTRSAEGVWAQQDAKLTAKAGEESEKGVAFGAGVALSADGYTALAGGPANSSGAGAAWAFVNPPTVSNVSPDKGPEAGGTSVTITGTNFNEAATVRFGSSNATSFEVVSPTSITAVAPAGAGAVDVRVSTSGGTSATGSADKFSYVPPPTVVTGIASPVGQTTATLNATVNPNGGEVSDCKLEYGPTASYEKSVPCTPSPGSGTEPVAVSAPLKNLSVNTTYHFRIVATNTDGTSKGEDQTFKTLPNAPTVSNVNPNAGPTAGGTSVIITGTNFSEAAAVKFGSNGATSFKVDSPTSITAVSPAGAGTVDVTVTNPGGTSATSSADDFSYVALPTVAKVSPDKGPTAGGTSVTIIGTDLSEATAVEFGSTKAKVTADSETSITAVSPAGAGTVDVTVSTAGGTSHTSTADQFSYVPTPTVVTEEASSIAQTTGTLNATVNPNGGEVTSCEFDYGTTKAYGKSAPCSSLPGSGNSPVAVSAGIEGLAPNTTYHFRIVATNPGGTSKGEDQTFETLPNAPTVVTGAASSLTQTSATLNATVNPNGGVVSDCKLEYGTSASYGSSVSCTPSPGSGTSPVAVSALLKELGPNTTYHFRIVAKNAGGTSSGVDQTFKTLPNAPAVVTEEVSSIAQTSATLNATVNPHGQEASECHFEYGPTTSYGTTVPCKPSPGSGNSPVEVSASLTGLSPNTTYHFRIVATNTGGTSRSADASFKTLPDRPTVVTSLASAVTQTTATLNATVNPNGGSVSSCELEYGPTEAYGSIASCSPSPGSGSTPVGVAAAITGLSVNTTYHFRVVAANAGGTGTGSDGTFKTLPNPPTVVTGSGSPVTQTTATLNATVNPNGGEVSSCKLEYGPTQSYGSSAACSPPPGSGNAALAVSAAVGSLSPNTTYHFRVVATNPGGTSPGADQTFKTLPNPPTVVTKAALSITQTSATLNATVNPNGGEVSSCKLEYGPTQSYGSSAACSPPPGSGGSAVAVSAAVGSLSANMTYHFRVVATNAGGTGTGNDGTFKTLPNPPTVETEKASFPPTPTEATLNATVNPNGGEISNCYFEYGETISYGSSAQCSSLPGSGSSPAAVSASVMGLIKNTTYHYRIVATNTGGTGRGADQTFETAPGPPTVIFGPPSSIGQVSAILNAEINPNGGVITQCYFHYEKATPGAEVIITPCVGLPLSGKKPVPVSALAEGLGAATSYRFSIEVKNSFGETTFSPPPEGEPPEFKTLPGPSVVTGAASSVTQTSATLNATVNPNGGEVSDCHFEYGTSESYGKSVPCTPSSPGSGTSPVAVSAKLQGLSLKTQYYFRVVATNPGGTSKDTRGQAFTTLPEPPVAATAAASSPTQTSVTLNGTVNPNGGTVSDCHFEYGASASYGSNVPCSSLPAGSGESPVPVSAALGGLSANTTYHFRIVATNPGGANLGGDQSFTTAPVPPTTSTPETTPTTTTPTTAATTTTTTTMTPSRTSNTPVATCRVSLASTSVRTQTGGMAAIKLIWTGTGAGTCGGRLTLTVKAKGKHTRPKPTLIGAGAFSIPLGEAQIVRLRLNEAGRALLNADHGRLSASLAILELFPDPSQAQTETVNLAREARSSSKRKQ